MSFTLVFVDAFGKLVFEKCYCVENASQYFLNTLDNIEEKLLLNICKNKTLISIDTLFPYELIRFNNASKSEI